MLFGQKSLLNINAKRSNKDYEAARRKNVEATFGVKNVFITLQKVNFFILFSSTNIETFLKRDTLRNKMTFSAKMYQNEVTLCSKHKTTLPIEQKKKEKKILEK